MKKVLQFAFVFLVFNFNSWADKMPVQIISQSNNELVIKLTSPNWALTNVSSPSGIVTRDGGTSLMQKGFPDLSKYAIPVNVPQNTDMSNEIISAGNFSDVAQEILPSKGTLSRAIDPSTVAYEYNDAYNVNSFYPNSIVTTGTPYFIRNQKGQTLNIIPFQYNPVTKTLRVYNDVTVKITFKPSKIKATPALKFNSDKEFEAIYADHFINYNSNASGAKTTYVPVNEDGDMLIICDDAFSSKMTPFVAWKNLKGIKTTMVLRSGITTGSITPALIKSYITNFIISNPNLKYVLLVGDHQQIPSSSTTAGPSDNEYGYLVGGDSYPEIFIGRFSAQNATDVETQVNKSINYEKYPQLYGSFYNVGACIASDQGPGDNGEMDFQHQQIIRAKLQAFTYGTVQEFYDGTQGGTDAPGAPTGVMVQNFINANGAGIIAYTGHGSDMSWGTSGFNTGNIANLTNTNKLPFIISVACVNGNFTTNNACFAEAWLRAGTPAAPKGAIGTAMSTINQYWNEPMAGQDHMIDVLATNTVSIKRSWAGICMNGCMFMNDKYPGTGDDMTDTWVVFGDPSLRVTTDATSPMTVAHPASVNLGTNNITVNSNTNDALICFNVLGNILKTGKIVGTSVNLNFPALVATDTIFVTATVFNKTPYFGKIVVNATTTGINSLSNDNGLVVYPNPANDVVNIKFNNQSFEYEVLNVIGQKVLSSNSKSVNHETIDIKGLAEGAYILKVRTDKDIKFYKFTKAGN